MAVIPITQQQTNTELNDAKASYYEMLKQGASSSDLENQLEVVTKLQTLYDSFISGSEYSSMVSIATSYFDAAISSLSASDITNAFDAYSNLSSYIQNNMINYNSTTNQPVFTNGTVAQLFSDNGNKINVYGK